MRRPEEVISQINHIFLYSSGQLPRRSLAGRKYQIFKCVQRLYRNLQEAVSRFAHTHSCALPSRPHICCWPREEKKHLKYRETPGNIVLNASLRHALCVERKRTVSAENQGGASTPTAREGEKWPECRPSDSQQKYYYKSVHFHHSGSSGSVNRKHSSGLDRTHLSRTSAPCHSESHVVGGSADALTRHWRGKRASRRRPGRARGEKQGCTECRRFPLRA